MTGLTGFFDVWWSWLWKMLFFGQRHDGCRWNAFATITRPWRMSSGSRGHTNRPGTNQFRTSIFDTFLRSLRTFCNWLFCYCFAASSSEARRTAGLWNGLIFFQESHTLSHIDWFFLEHCFFLMKTSSIEVYQKCVAKWINTDEMVWSLAYSIHNWLKNIGRNFFCKCYARHDKSYSSHYSATMRALCGYDHFAFLLGCGRCHFSIPFLK